MVWALVLALAGCSRQEPAPLDTLRWQLLREACEALQSGDTGRAQEAIRRLAATGRAQDFAAAALERVERQAGLAEMSRLIREGRIEEATRRLQDATGAAFKAASEAAPAVESLAALQAYASQRPFATSEAAEKALRALNPHRPLLDQSPAFAAFVQAETAGLMALRQREQGQVVEWLVGELDAAAVSGAPNTSCRLSHLTSLRPSHELVKTWAAASVSDIGALGELGRQAVRDPGSRLAFEVGVCLAWHAMNDAAWRAVLPVFVQGQPAGFSGQLLAAAAAAELGEYEEGVRNLHALAAEMAIDPRHVSRLLSRYVLAPQQAQAWCWRSPCPGVADILGSILQLRTSRPR